MITIPKAIEERKGFKECFTQYIMGDDDTVDDRASELDKATEAVTFARTLKLETRMCAMLFHKKHAAGVKKKKIEDALAEFQGYELDASVHCHPVLWKAARGIQILKPSGEKGAGEAEEPAKKKQRKTSKSEKSER